MRTSISIMSGVIGAAALLSTWVAQAATFNVGIVGTTPIVVDVAVPSGGLFLDTINFEVADPNTLFNTLVETNNISFFGAPIFENTGDTEVFNEPGGVYFIQPLDPGPPGFHLHPQGLRGAGSGSYRITLFTTPAAVPIPAAAWLMLTGLAGLGALARRKKFAS